MALLSLTAVGMFVESRIPAGWVEGKQRRLLLWVCTLLFAILLWDVENKPFPQDFPSMTSVFEADQAFVAQSPNKDYESVLSATFGKPALSEH